MRRDDAAMKGMMRLEVACINTYVSITKTVTSTGIYQLIDATNPSSCMWIISDEY
jgi:hypothetical protein